MVSLGVAPILTSCQKFNLLATLSALSANATEIDNIASSEILMSVNDEVVFSVRVGMMLPVPIVEH